MSEYREIMAVMNNGPISVAIKIPLAESGSAPYYLEDVATQVKAMFESACKSVSDWDMVLEETIDDVDE